MAADLTAALSIGVMLEAALLVLAFIGVLFAGSKLLPGGRISGPDPNGTTRTNKLNGLRLFLILALGVGAGEALGWLSLAVLHSHFLALLVMANVLAFALAGWLYVRGRRRGTDSPGSWRGFFLGIEASPAVLGVDLTL